MLLPFLLTYEKARKQLSESHAGALAVVGYGVRPGWENSTLHIQIPLRTLADDVRVELWPARGCVQRKVEQSVQVSYDGERLLGVIPLSGMADGTLFEETIRAAYAALTEVCASSGYLHPLRVWNYIPGIHEMHADLDRYQAFCRARHEPLARYLKSIGDGFPAATVVGTRTGEGVLYFLAGRQAGRHLENPRQLPATEYPQCYGPRSPSFSRATLAQIGSECALYISGTGSIVGHESRHPYDTGRQLEEVLRNLEELIRSAGREGGSAFRGLGDLAFVRVYLRDLAEAPAVGATLTETLAPQTAIVVHEGDLCRRELMIEIEGIAVPGQGAREGRDMKE